MTRKELQNVVSCLQRKAQIEDITEQAAEEEL